MEYRGQVRKGVVVLEGRVKLPEGTKVTVREVPKRTSKSSKPKGKTLYERLKPIIGKAKDMPADFAKNHDHYIHGQPKK